MAEPFQPTPRATALVVSDKLRKQEVFIVGPSASLLGCWDCCYHKDAGNGSRRHEVVLTTAQLGPVRKEPPG